MSYPKGMKGGPRLPCRVCGKPTKHYMHKGRNALLCDNPECKEKSKLITSEKQSIAHKNNPKVSAAARRKWDEIKGKSFSPAPCRVCGQPTKFRDDSPQANMRVCDKESCRAESRRRKNEAIRQAALKRYADGTRPRGNRWKSVPRVSKIETEVIGPALLANGWKDQHKLVPGVKGVRAPRTYHLDFALPEKKICVEIDGSSHRKEKQRLRDEKRDQYLAEIGWRTLRFTNDEVVADPTAIVGKILAFAAGNAIIVDPPQLCEWCRQPMPRSIRKTCSRDCQSKLHAETIRGRTVVRARRESAEQDSRGAAILNRSWIPCRICGKPTKLNGTAAHPRYHTTACDDPDCRTKAKELTRQNQSKALKGNRKLIESTQAAWDRREGVERLWIKNRRSDPSVN